MPFDRLPQVELGGAEHVDDVRALWLELHVLLEESSDDTFRLGERAFATCGLP